MTRIAPAFQTSFLSGFRAIVPLWLSIAPFAAAYVVTARAAGWLEQRYSRGERLPQRRVL